MKTLTFPRGDAQLCISRRKDGSYTASIMSRKFLQMAFATGETLRVAPADDLLPACVWVGRAAFDLLPGEVAQVEALLQGQAVAA